MTTTVPMPREETEERTRTQPPYHVVLINDDDHTYEYVVLMLLELFGHPLEKGFQMAQEVDKSGRGVVDTTSMERAEVKREQIHAYGAEPRIPRLARALAAGNEPAL